VRVIVGTQPRVDDINMFMLAQLLFDIRPLEKHVLSFASAYLLLGELYAVHRQFGMTFLD
jgi:hypothetical protein